ncbi:alpha/beta fold hydrolase [Symbioplanes lichenis]|uniref:alpha/beta fold hydrolase n=1 Tax=Symbioplanes lichenis TaxID=1629072 RepID=UPI002738E1AA|nr:alpha/beta hydrolase [Actinoplanes lichenis]
MTLRTFDTGGDGLPVLWHHGTPNTGEPPRPLLHPGIRWISYDRPGYGASTPAPGRRVGDAAQWATTVADELGIGRFADGLDFFRGMGPAGTSALRAAADGRTEKGDEVDFIPADLAMFDGPWGWFGEVVRAAVASGPEPEQADDHAYVSPWGCDPASITAPVLLLHGGRDLIAPSSHSAWLAGRIPGAELCVVPDAGHISVLRDADAAMAWLRARASWDQATDRAS